MPTSLNFLEPEDIFDAMNSIKIASSGEPQVLNRDLLCPGDRALPDYHCQVAIFHCWISFRGTKWTSRSQAEESSVNATNCLSLLLRNDASISSKLVKYSFFFNFILFSMRVLHWVKNLLLLQGTRPKKHRKKCNPLPNEDFSFYSIVM